MLSSPDDMMRTDLVLTAVVSAALAAEMLKKDSAKIADTIGRPLTPGETYLIHFLGPDDTERFMKAVVESPKATMTFSCENAVAVPPMTKARSL